MFEATWFVIAATGNEHTSQPTVYSKGLNVPHSGNSWVQYFGRKTLFHETPCPMSYHPQGTESPPVEAPLRPVASGAPAGEAALLRALLWSRSSFPEESLQWGL